MHHNEGYVENNDDCDDTDEYTFIGAAYNEDILYVLQIRTMMAMEMTTQYHHKHKWNRLRDNNMNSPISNEFCNEIDDSAMEILMRPDGTLVILIWMGTDMGIFNCYNLAYNRGICCIGWRL